MAGKFVLWTNLGISVAEQEFDLKYFAGAADKPERYGEVEVLR